MPVRPLLFVVFAGAVGLTGVPAPAQDGEPTPEGEPQLSEPQLTEVQRAIRSQQAVWEAAEAELERLLARPAGEVLEAGEPIAARGDTLDEALAKIAEKAGLPILPDRKSLDLEGLKLRDFVLVDPPSVPEGVPITLARMIELLLESLPGVPLTAVNDGGLLRVTTVTEAETRLISRTYDVRDLVRYRATRAASAGLLLDNYGPGGLGGGMGAGGGGLGGGGGGFGAGGRGAGGFGGGAFSLPATGAAVAAGPVIAGASQGGEITASDRAAAEWEARLKFFERKLELLPGDPDDAVYGYNFQPLIDLIVSSTGGPDNGGDWEEDGGFGSIEELETGPAGSGRAVLVVRQTDAVHRQIVRLLADLRAAPGRPLDPLDEAEGDEDDDAPDDDD